MQSFNEWRQQNEIFGLIAKKIGRPIKPFIIGSVESPIGATGKKKRRKKKTPRR